MRAFRAITASFARMENLPELVQYHVKVDSVQQIE